MPPRRQLPPMRLALFFLDVRRHGFGGGLNPRSRRRLECVAGYLSGSMRPTGEVLVLLGRGLKPSEPLPNGLANNECAS